MTRAGWPIVGWATALLLSMVAALLAIEGTGEEGVRAVIRHTAQTSFVLFIPAYAASSLRALWHTPATKWLLANRRYLGVSFAVSHTLHLAFILELYRSSAAFRSDISISTVVGGGLAYVFLFAMAATSFDRSAAWLGRRAWKTLHTAGVHWIWFIFFVSYMPRALQSPAYLPFAAILLGGVGLRIAAYRRRRAHIEAVAVRSQAPPT